LSPEIIAPAVVGWFFLLLWMLFQLVPWDSTELGHPAWGLAASALDERLGGSISVDPTATKLALLRHLILGGVFLSVYCLSRQRENAALFLGILIGFFCFYAAFGLIRLSFQIDRIWWFPVGNVSSFTGTFIGRNTAATYFGLGVVTVTALLARSLNRALQLGSNLSGADRRDVFVDALTGSFGRLAVIWLLLLTALLLTASRGGILASLGAIAVMLFLRTFRGRNKPGSLSRFVIGGSLLLAVVVVIEVAGGKFLSRLFISGIKDIDRYHAMQAAVTAASDHLWTGSGAGTFQSIFPLYRPASLDKTGFWSSAHSDYLDSLVGLGVPGFGALLFILANLAYRTLKGVRARRRDSHFALIALSATVLVGLHGFVDFSLQIQGVTTTYIALMGMGVAQSQGSQRG
jgi:O-antigen ligase